MVKRVISDKDINQKMQDTSSRMKIVIHKNESESRASALARALVDEISLIDSDRRTERGRKVAKAQQAICDIEKMIRDLEESQ